MSGSGLHPIIRTGLSSALRGIAPLLINSIANKIAGTGKKRIYKKRTGGAIIHRPLIRIGVGVGACRKHKSGTGKKRCIRKTRQISSGAWQLSTTRGGSQKRRVGRPCVRRTRAIRV